MGAVKSATGLFELSGDTDWFRVKLTAGSTYEVRGVLEFGGQPITFRVLRPDGQQLHQPIAFGNYANFVAPVSGDYFIAATGGFVNTIPGVYYSLTVEDVVDPIPASPATTRTLAVGGTETVTGNNNAVTQNDDWFAISVTAGQSYVLNTNLITGRVYFTDANGQVLAIEGFQASGGQQAHFTATTTGTLYAGASHGGGPQYTLSLIAVADDRGNTAATAGALTLGTPATGRWEAAGDDDAYLVSLTAGQSYNFAVQNLDNATIPPFVRILDIAGNLLWTSQSQSSPSSTVFAPATTGNYLVSVGIGAVGSSDPTPLRYLDGWNHSLTGAVVAGDLTDNPTTTGVVTVGGVAAASAYNGAGDRDWLRVDLVEGQSYTFTLTTSVWNGVTLALYDPQSALLKSAGNTNTGSYLHHTAATTGSYFLSTTQGTAPGSYTLAAATVADDFANNATSTGTIAVNGTASGTFEVTGDSDWFAVSLVQGVNYELIPFASGLNVGIRNAQGVALTGPGVDLSFVAPATGIYYLEAQGASGNYAVGIRFSSDDFGENTATTGVIRRTINGTSGSDSFRGGVDYETFNGFDGNDFFFAGDGFDVFNGHLGEDTVSYVELGRAIDASLQRGSSRVNGVQYDLLNGIENLIGSAFDDMLTGDGGANILEGGAGNDVLDGGSGADTLIGRGGDDTFYVFFLGSLPDVVLESAGGGNDRVLTSVSFTLTAGSEVETLETTNSASTGNINLTGNAGTQTLIGNAGSNVLDGGAGDDTMVGGFGNDVYVVDTVGDVVTEAESQGVDEIRTALSTYSIAALANVENLTGAAGTQVLTGNTGANVIDGGAGADAMAGGLGNDTYLVDDVGDTVTEAVNEGTDEIRTTLASYSLAGLPNVENLTGTSNSGQSLTGNAGVNAITAGSGNDTLDSGAGADVLTGGGGNDFYIVDDVGDAIIEAAGGGTDYVGARISYALAAAAQVETLSALVQGGTDALNLTGNGFAQDLIGNNGANILDGGGGADRLIGLGGDDVLYVDSSDDQAIEFVGGGRDYVAAKVSFTLAAGAEVETLSTFSHGGTEAINLTGNAFAQDLIGNFGANVLTGGGGADRLIGLAGDDFYVVDSADDLVIEYAGDGRDYVAASASYVLAAGAEVETLSALEQGGTVALDLTGNAFAQDLIGNNGGNLLNGGGGADRLIGLGGDDFYVIDSADDSIVEFAGGGVDYVFARASWTLSAGAEVETVSTESHAGTAAIDLNGNELANTMIGNNGANILNGRGGADRLVGLGGADAFVFNTALGGGNVDQILDMTVGVDKIILDDAVFAGLALGNLAAGAFNTGSTASDADDRILYDAASGALYFDADGAGGAAAVQFASVSAGLAMSASEFTVI